jgi:hypothetical protein
MAQGNLCACGVAEATPFQNSDLIKAALDEFEGPEVVQVQDAFGVAVGGGDDQ